jgi:uncharacterized SAM-binding protein YcdF (DUF218 family)
VVVTRRRKWIFRIALALALLVLATVAFACFFPQKLLCVDSGPVRADVIVVLGGGTGLHERPERAVELFKEHDAPRIILSGLGDSGGNRAMLIRAGVPKNAIGIEGQSRTTRENAEFTIKLLRAENAHRVILVTSWYHSRRALRCFEHYAPDIQFYSRPSYFAYARADWPGEHVVHRIYLEYPKLAGYWVYYGVRPF